ncbi:MAG: MarR family transcriptional regulator, partial [Lachnospiraceae bacterium]|nr:MarR family transcriptional regulator [Lachnospiraceae bacterium]
YIVFMVLWENDGISVGELGRKLYLDNGTLTPLLKKMQEKGYLTRMRSKEDERVVIVTLTEEGWAMREKVRAIPEEVGSCIPLSPEEARTLYNLLYRVIDSMEH